MVRPAERRDVHDIRAIDAQVYPRPWSEKMTIENNHLSSHDSRHPTNTVWDGASHGDLLLPFSSAPGAPAGCGFGEWSTQKPMTLYGEEILLSLSEFSTQPVTIQYEVVAADSILGTGSAVFGLVGNHRLSGDQQTGN